MHMITHIPASPLNQFVEIVIYYKGYMPEHSLEKVVPDGSIYLIFELDGVARTAINSGSGQRFENRRVWVSGMQKSYLTITAVSDSEMSVVKFKPYGALPFLDYPLTELNDKVIAAEKVCDQSVFALREELVQTTEEAEKMALVETWLRSQFEPKNTPPDYIISACETMKRDPVFKFNSIADLIGEANVSKKHFVDQFKKYTGVTPKQLQRIFRFNEMLTAVQEKKQVGWVEIALSCGYYDQAHFIKEFKAFCGMNPSEFIVDYHDTERVNFFPLD